jgi:YARHG domain-containing protein
MRRLRRLLLVPLVATTLAAPGCGKGKESPPGPAPTGAAPAAAGDATAPSTGEIATTGAASDAAAPGTGTPAAPSAPSDARPLYYERALTAADLDGRTLRELSLMRNTIFARAGNTFRKPWLRDYFTAQPWYKPLAKTDESRLSEYDRANARAIAEREQNLAKPDLEKSRAALLAKASRTPEEEIELSLIAIRLGGVEPAPSGTPASGTPPAEKRNPLEDPDQLDRLLALDELEVLSRRDLRILRNTVYARRGRPFKSELLQQWFGDMDWYHADDSYTDERLTSIDQKNIRLIKSVEDSLGGPLTDHAHKEEDGWFAES